MSLNILSNVKQQRGTELILNNRYFVLRHGRSLANEAGIIISNMQDGVEGWGLAPDSETEIRKSFEGSDLTPDTLIFSSPFKRAYETALVAAEVLKCAPPQKADPLRERFFGLLDGQTDSHYPDVWADDILNAENKKLGVESPAEVLNRLSEFLMNTDSGLSGRIILLVSHGDPLNILLAFAAGSPLVRHMKNDPMKTAELRNLLV